MGIPDQRDAHDSARRLERWLARALPDAEGVVVGDLTTPDATGFSNETLLLEVAWPDPDDLRPAGLAVRIAPTGYQLFPTSEFDRQYRVLQWLGHHADLPVPSVLAYEQDPDVLGAPFFVMERVVGRVPADNPPYHAAGWVTDLDHAGRARVWWGGVDSIAAIHAVDLDLEALAFLRRPELGATPVEQELGYYEQYLDWVEQDEPVPAAGRARQWLRDHLPDTCGRTPVLAWGDARIGNIVFDDALAPAAILDWEMATLGDPELDVAWTLFMDHHHTRLGGVQRLPGLPSRDATVRRYEQATGRRLEHLDYYEVLGAFRFAVIWARLAVLFKQWGLLEPDARMAQEGPACQIIDELLETR
jgi:aminoglycoside phosphotransferase (APT) family kinase protein